MEIKDHHLQRFIELYKQESGVTLGKSEAHEKALKLLHYAALCIKPLAKNDTGAITEMRNEGE